MKKIDRYIKEKINNCHNKIVVITGANSGIGYETMKVLASKGAHIVMACRSIERATKAKNNVLSEFPNSQIDILEFDQSSFKSIDNFIKNLKNAYPHIDVLICNAGIYHPKEGQITEDNFPLTIGTNYLGLFYLVEKLRDGYLNDTKLILVSSIVYKYAKIKDYKFLKEENYKAFKQYSISKLCIARYFEYLKNNTDLNVYLMHPGISATNIFTSPTSSYKRLFKNLANKLLPLLVHSPKKAALSLSLLSANEYKNHTFLGPRGPFEISGYPRVLKLRKNGRKNAEILYQKTKNAIKDGVNYVECK